MNTFESICIMMVFSALFKAKMTILCPFEVMGQYQTFGTSHTLSQANNSSEAIQVEIVVDLDSFYFPSIDIANCTKYIYITSLKENDVLNLSEIQPIFIESIGYYYAEFLYQLFNSWAMKLDSLTIVSDDSGTVIEESMLWSVKDSVAVVVLKNYSAHSDNMNLMTNTRNFFVIGRRSYITALLEKGRQLNMLSASNVWFVLATDGTFENFVKTEGIILSLSDNYIESLNKTISNTTGPYGTILLNTTLTCSNKDTNETQNLRNYITDIIQTIELNIEIMELSDNTANTVINWTTLHIIQSARKDKVGSFNKRDVNKLSRPQMMPTVRISFVHEQPYIFKKDVGLYTKYSGFLVDVITDLSINVNFSYVLKECTDGVYGLKEGNDWTGCIGDLLHNRADMILAPLAVTSEREAVLDFLTPYLGTTGVQVLMKRAMPKDFRFVDVYTRTIWLSILASIIVTSTLLYTFHRYAPNCDYHNSRRVNFGDTIWFVISSVCYEGSDRLWINACTKLLIAGFWFFSTILMSCFTANMAALLTNMRLADDSTTVLDEIKNRVSNFTVVGNSFEFLYIKKLADYEEYFTNVWMNQMYKSFQDENNTVWTFPLSITFSNLMNDLLRNPLPNSTQSAMEKINHNFRLILDSSVASYINLHQKNCAVRIASDPIAIHPIGLAVTQGSRYQKALSERLLMLQQAQTFERLKHKWWDYKSSSCISNNVNEGLSFEDLQYSFSVLGVGIVASLLALFAEILYNKVKYKIFLRLSSQKDKQSNTNVQNVDKSTGNEDENTGAHVNKQPNNDCGSIDLIFTIDDVSRNNNKNTQDIYSLNSSETPELECLSL